ncbi:MAG TPA: NAD(P)/FAD-dependent oxidoreductase [Bacteroidia bacterium]|nr:NAD(P)/FAD-dependent oxidoreductase [Bacteroidia bacterium]
MNNLISTDNLFIPESKLPRVIIIGGGFAGIEFTKKLSHEKFQLVMLDKHNYHTFQPLLYQVATSGLEADSISMPLRKIFAHRKNSYFRLCEVLSVDAEKKILQTNIGQLKYDYLVIATGSSTNYFGMENIMKYAMPMKTVPEALDLRSLILQNMEQAVMTEDEKIKQSFLDFVIVGGGPTGVELAGALSELKNNVLPNDYAEIDFRFMQIHLVEMGTRILSGMSERASEKAQEFLEKFGVKIWLGVSVTDYDNYEVKLSNGGILFSKALIWTGGVTGMTIDGLPPSSIVKGNRIQVDAFNKVEGASTIFAVGDVAAMLSKENPQPYPMLAQVAIQQGRHLAKNLNASLKGKAMTPFRYLDYGTLATIGRNRAVADFPVIRLQGRIAWFAWTFIHLMQLVGFRNRLVVFVNWMWSYINYDSAIRLIIRPFVRRKKS